LNSECFNSKIKEYTNQVKGIYSLSNLVRYQDIA